jgi:hypothetical protein
MVGRRRGSAGRGVATVVASLVVVLGGAGLACPGSARADRIVLRGGGQVRGKVVADPKRPDHVNVILERGKTPLSLQKAQVAQVIAEPSALDDYVVKRASAPETAQGQYDLGVWSAEHKLNDLAELHYEAALKLDKSFAPAHQKLGHAQIQGHWVSGDELREAQGLVRYKGRWITKEEMELKEKDGATAAEQSSWFRRIRAWREALESSADDRRREAETQLMAIRDPAAVAPLVRALGGDTDRVRQLLARVLGSIPSPESASALVHRLLAEDESDVRGSFMDELARRKEPEVNKTLVQALRSKTPATINRAAWALAHLDAVSSVPSLVGALVSTHSRMEMVPSPAGSSEGMSINATFGTGPLLPVQSPYGAPIAYNGSSIGYLNGVAVGPGVVAFGASAVPAYPLPPLPSEMAFVTGGTPPPAASLGVSAGGGLNASRGPVPRMVSYTFQNTEVLAALVKLTGQDFGYDGAAWRRWLRTSFQPEPVPARRVPQP